MRFPNILAIAALPASLIAAASPASANCARPVGYEATVTGNTVKIEPVTWDGRVCPDPDGMLRQTVGTGEIVKLADFCQAGTEFSAYVDECVPAGTYRYGYAKPYTCNEQACDTSYFVEATVSDALASGCTRSTGNAEPATAASVPWKDDPVICAYQEDPCWNSSLPGCGTTSSSSSSGGGGGGGGATDNGSPQSSGGCSVAITPGTGSVLGANVLALIVGLALMRRRRGATP